MGDFYRWYGNQDKPQVFLKAMNSRKFLLCLTLMLSMGASAQSVTFGPVTHGPVSHGPVTHPQYSGIFSNAPKIVTPYYLNTIRPVRPYQNRIFIVETPNYYSRDRVILIYDDNPPPLVDREQVIFIEYIE